MLTGEHLSPAFMAPNSFASKELMLLSDAELDEVGAGCAGPIILVACAIVAGYCIYKMATQ